MLVISFISGAFAALPVSSSAHYAFLNSVLHFSSDADTLGFYYSIISVVFSLVVFVFLRKLYSKSIASFFRSGKGGGSDKHSQYKSIAVNLFLSLLPAVILFLQHGQQASSLHLLLRSSSQTAALRIRLSPEHWFCPARLLFSRANSKQSFPIGTS